MVEQWSACLSGMQFSTRDQVSPPAVVHHVSYSADNANDDCDDSDDGHRQDNDRYLQGSCAEENKAGWWYNR